MSEESAKAFLKMLGEDKELQEKVKGVDSEEEFFAVVKEVGLDFTKEEWLEVDPRFSEGQLTDKDLVQVYGGGTEAASGCHWENVNVRVLVDPALEEKLRADRKASHPTVSGFGDASCGHGCPPCGAPWADGCSCPPGTGGCNNCA